MKTTITVEIEYQLRGRWLWRALDVVGLHDLAMRGLLRFGRWRTSGGPWKRLSTLL